MYPNREASPYRWLFAHYLKPYWPSVVLLGLVLLTSIAIQVGTPLIASRFIDQITIGGTMHSLVFLAMATIGLGFSRQFISTIETYLAENLGWKATNALRLDLIRHTLSLDTAFHARHPLGEMIERVDGDVSTLANVFSRFIVSILGNVLLLVAILVLLLGVDALIFVTLTAIVLLILLVFTFIRRYGAPFWTVERDVNSDFYSFLGEYLSGMEDLRANGARGFVLRRFVEIMRVWKKARIRAQMTSFYALASSSEFLFGLGTVATMGISAIRYRDGDISLGNVYLVFQYTLMLRTPANQIRHEVQDLQRADAGIGRISWLFNQEPVILDEGCRALPTGDLDVSFNGVTFAYKPGNPVLHDVTFQVAPGNVLGIAGRTGSGKTTLTRMLMRSHDPDTGSVTVGGTDIRQVPLTCLRNRIGIVTQDVHLFSAPIRDAITIFDETISDQAITDALDAVGMGDWIRSLPLGLDTVLAQSGGELSAGQAQILACVRLLLKNPDVVILDEPSSRLDPATERHLNLAFRKLLQGRTGIVIAHRLSTFDLVDQILVMDDGHVLEHGNKDCLMADPKSRFSQLLAIANDEVTA